MKPYTISFILIFALLSSFFSSCAKDTDVFAYAIQEDIAENIEEQESSEEEDDDESVDESSDETEEDNIETPNEEDTPSDDPNDDKNTEGDSFSDFGIVGDGVTDDTAALQSAINSGNNLIADEALILKVTLTINIKTSGDQFINWNGSTIDVAKSNLVVFIVDKPNGSLLTMNNLLVEGNNIGQDGFQISSPVVFDNVDVQNLYSSTNAPQAFAVFFDENFSQNSTLTNCDCTNLNGRSNNVIGDAIGASRCFGFYVGGIPSSRSTFTVSNFNFGEVWSEDGDVIDVKAITPIPAFEIEAKRVINLLPKIKPGIQDGKKVTVPYGLPIVFRVAN